MSFRPNAENEEGECRKRSRKEILAEPFASLDDFLAIDKLSERPVSDEEKKELLRLAKIMQPDATVYISSDRYEPQTILISWKGAVESVSQQGKCVTAENVVEKFLSIHLEGLKLPTEEDDRRADVALAVCKFINTSPFPGTLAGHLERRLSEPELRELAEEFSCSIITCCGCGGVFTLNLGVVRETDVGAAVTRKYTAGGEGADAVGDSAEKKNWVDLPLVIGGESGAGKTFFSPLAPEYVCAGRGESGGVTPTDALVIYTLAGDGGTSYLRAVQAVRAADDALQAAKRNGGGGPVAELCERRTAAAVEYLQQLVYNTIEGWDGPMELRPEEKYKCLFIVVDELSSEIALFRSLLEAGGEEGREKLLGFAKGLADTAQLICCGTGNPRLVIDRCADAGEYRSIVMGPSTLLFERLLQTGGVRGAAAGTLMGSPLLSAVVENRRAGKYAAEVVLDNLGDATKCSEAEQLQKLRLL